MTIKDITNILQNRDYKSPDDVRRLFDSLEKYISIPNLILGEGNLLYRARVVNDVSEISSISALSYTPSKYNKTYKRASTPYNTMFYGISGDSHTNMLCGCFSETCECFRNPNAPYKDYNVVIGVWETKKDLTLPQIINIDGNNKSDDFDNADEFKGLLNSIGNFGDDIADFWRYMNNQFTKNAYKQEDYWVSAIFSEWLVQKMGYDGIIYESVQSVDPKLFNNHCIALTPEVSDQHLQFREALYYEIPYDGSPIVLPTHKRLNITSRIP